MIEDEIKDHRSGIIEDECFGKTLRRRERGRGLWKWWEKIDPRFGFCLYRKRERERDKLTMRDIFGTDGMRLCAYISLCCLYTLTARALRVARLSFLFFCRNVFCVFQLLWNYKIKINK